MSDSQNQTVERHKLNVMRSFIRAVFIPLIYPHPIVRAIARHIPGIGKLVQSMYKLIPSEQWINLHGSPCLINIHHGLGTPLFFHGEYYSPARISEIQEVVKEGDTVIDIGANIGYFTILLANLVGPKGRVYAFEPDPRNFSLLQCTIERNGWTQVIAEQKAVSNKTEELLLYQTKSRTDNSLTPTEHISTVKVQVVALDDFLPDEHHISFVKMDMDGSEPLAIQGMTRLIQQSPNIRVLAEYEPGNVKRYLSAPLDFITIAEQHGLSLTAILDSYKGRLPNLDLTPLKHLVDNEHFDLLFTASTLEG